MQFSTSTNICEWDDEGDGRQLSAALHNILLNGRTCGEQEIQWIHHDFGIHLAI